MYGTFYKKKGQGLNGWSIHKFFPTFNKQIKKKHYDSQKEIYVEAKNFKSTYNCITIIHQRIPYVRFKRSYLGLLDCFEVVFVDTASNNIKLDMNIYPYKREFKFCLKSL